MKRTQLLPWLIAAATLLWAPVSRAQPSGPAEQLVFWPYVTNGTEYRRVAYPPQVDTIWVLAETPVVLEARRSLVSYWPLTGEYLADFAALNDPVPGSLEIVAPSGEVRRVPPRPFTIWYPDGVAAARSEMLFDEAARLLYDSYVQDARRAAAATQAFEQRRAEYEASVDAWLKQAAAKANPLPPPPAEFSELPPPPYYGYATEIQEAPVVSLPAGEYRVQWRGTDGAVLSGSERRLVSFAARREGIGYRMLPEDRWTQPSALYSPDQVLYLTGSTPLYLQPIVVQEYAASLYVRILQPQTLAPPDPSRYIWVPRGPAPGARLSVWQGERQVATIPEVPYRVVQNEGTLRGYAIRPLNAVDPALQLEPDFVAMRLPVELSAVSSLSLATADGTAVSSSRREVRQVGLAPGALVYAPASIPLLLLAAVRRRSTRRRTSRTVGPRASA